MTNNKNKFFAYEIIALKDKGDSFIPCNETEVEIWGLFGVLYEGKKHVTLERIYASPDLKDCTATHYRITGHKDYYLSMVEEGDDDD